MILDVARTSIQGHIKIIDKDTNEVLLDTQNDVLFGNMSIALAQSLIGNPNSLLYYMAFGNGAAYLNNIGGIVYKPSLGGVGSEVKNPTANLYNTILVEKVSNNATSSFDYTQSSRAYITTENYSTGYEDIIIDVTIPPAIAFPTGTITINEIGLFAGTNNLFAGNATSTQSDIDNFVSQSPNFSGTAGSKSKLMLTHAVFHPVTKTTIQSIEIIYTLRIQVGI